LKEGEGLFFFEKKNQKTFVTLAFACGAVVASRTAPKFKGFFASFCSQKEGHSFPLA
jgi:hypothetical protein